MSFRPPRPEQRPKIDVYGLFLFLEAFRFDG